VFNSRSNEYSLAPQFKWLEYTFNTRRKWPLVESLFPFFLVHWPKMASKNSTMSSTKYSPFLFQVSCVIRVHICSYKKCFEGTYCIDVYIFQEKKSVSWRKFILLKNALNKNTQKNRPVTPGGPDWGTLGKHLESEDKRWNPWGISLNNWRTKLQRPDKRLGSRHQSVPFQTPFFFRFWRLSK
jgi:hypothetical protein